MLCSINDYPLADGTFAGGYALSALKFAVTRVFDVVIPLEALLPVLFDRQVTRTAVDFQITRVHASFEAADQYVADHDAAIPSSGDVAFTALDGTVRYLLNAYLIQHTRVGGIGKTTVHAYHIEGGRISTQPHAYILMEDSGYILQEDGSKIEMEHD